VRRTGRVTPATNAEAGYVYEALRADTSMVNGAELHAYSSLDRLPLPAADQGRAQHYRRNVTPVSFTVMRCSARIVA
jgi:hypothetical protein